jgi:hypothetical protein
VDPESVWKGPQNALPHHKPWLLRVAQSAAPTAVALLVIPIEMLTVY